MGFTTARLSGHFGSPCKSHTDRPLILYLLHNEYAISSEDIKVPTKRNFLFDVFVDK